MPLISRGQHSNKDKYAVVEQFQQIDAEADTIAFTNHLELNNRGGHLQGIQGISKGGKRFIILSGSSSTYAYYAIVRTGAENRVTHIVKISDKPYKHAGGFQVWENMMAIGIEDNEAKNRSKVLLFDLSDPEHPPDVPCFVIERSGPFHRSTAGCVALTRLTNKWLLVVGDWDTKNLDFYMTGNGENPCKINPFKLVYSIEAENMDKTNWSDPSWLPYQNINLIYSEKGNLFLVGMTANGNNEDVADLFKIDFSEALGVALFKVATRNFGVNKNTKFRWGAGIEKMPGGALQIISCGENIKTESSVSEFY